MRGVDRALHVGSALLFPELTEQMKKLVGQGEAEDSSDVLGSAVWALWDLFLDPEGRLWVGAVKALRSGFRESRLT
ncbi:hypothetical protein GCM10012285_41970 [Streptomyces kronopolitis]|uniref:Uncharacterized protein n=1 Tax=Streptomyces kronopolitis TaxID=1612435 RepID=A0ABQ2JQ24_9ACTN|nr:hypothetical protein GCM10012285_41970 [Streptomyces kronopolitis]